MSIPKFPTTISAAAEKNENVSVQNENGKIVVGVTNKSHDDTFSAEALLSPTEAGELVAALIAFGAVLSVEQIAAMSGTHVIVTGNLVDGFSFIGPVTPNDPAVDTYIDTALRGQDWYYVEPTTLKDAMETFDLL